MVTQRLSNIELCRLVSILLVMLVHTTSQSLGDNMSLGAFMLESFSIVGVNVFILITGYFSVTPKKTSLLNIAFICLFWMIVKLMCRYECGQSIKYEHLFFITTSNWFIANYLGLLFLAPILNSFCNSSSRRSLLGVVISLLVIEVWFDLLPPHPTVKLGTQYGYSVFSFAIIYLIARYIKLYGLPYWFKNASLWIYIVISLFQGYAAYIGIVVGHASIGGLLFAYNNPIVIVSSVAFLISFERFNINSKFINHLAKSTLAVLLGHSAIFFVYTKQFKYLYDNYSGFEVIGYWLLSIAIVFLASIIIDQLRLLMWEPINGWLKTHIKNNNIY